MDSLTDNFTFDFDLDEDSFINGQEMQIINEVSSFATKEAQRYVKDVLELKRDTKPIFQKLVGKGLLTQIVEILEIRKNDVICNVSLGDHIYDIKCYESIIDICIWLFLYGDNDYKIIKKINSIKLYPNFPRESFSIISKIVRPYLNNGTLNNQVINFVDFTIEATHLQLFYGLSTRRQ